MILSDTQTTAFMGDGYQMGIPHDTVAQLHNKGIIIITNLINFNKSTIKQINANTCCSAGRIADTSPGAALGATIPPSPFIFGEKSQKRLVVAAELLYYYETVCRPTSAENFQWNPVMKNFELQWNSLDLLQSWLGNKLTERITNRL